MLLEVAAIAILHNQVQPVAICDERVDVLADVPMARLAHQNLLLVRRLHSITIAKRNHLHDVNSVVSCTNRA